MKDYSKEFYKKQSAGSKSSAMEVLPIVKELINPESVVDLGCGVAPWLATWSELGVKDILGVDGDYVNRDMLLIPRESFQPADLSKSFKGVKKYDLSMSLEVAEHLPESRAESFVQDLCDLSDIVLFSAAVPEQGGVEHVNEQWQDYWQLLFEKKGYRQIDCIRNKVWTNENVDWWYAQNVFLYANANAFEKFPALEKEYEIGKHQIKQVVHPALFMHAADLNNLMFSKFIRSFPSMMKSMMKRKTRKFLGKD